MTEGKFRILRCRDFDPVSAVMLRRVEHPIHFLDKISWIVARVSNGSFNTNAGGDKGADTGFFVGHSQHGNAAGTFFCKFARCGLVGFRQQQGELLAAKTGDHIARAASHGLQHGGEALQSLIVTDMSIKIVLLLEVIDVENDQRQGLSISH